MTESITTPFNEYSIQEHQHDLEKVIVRTVGRKATITKDELFQAALNLIGPQKSI